MTEPTVIDCPGCGGFGQIDPGSAAACPLCDGTGKATTTLSTFDLIERLRGPHAVFMTVEQGTVFLNEVADKIEELQGQLIWGFYEEEEPEYTQGSEKLHELHELVTAEECNGLVKTIKETQERVGELETENTKLRAALANSELPCVYCTLSKEDWSKCKSGFPGCGRADDAMGCPELGSSLRVEAAETAKIELAEHLDKTIAVAADAVNRMNAAEAKVVELEETSKYWMNEATAGIDGAKARITWKDRAKASKARVVELEKERDLAIAHDRQPYPTAAAYEAVCKARTKWQARCHDRYVETTCLQKVLENYATSIEKLAFEMEPPNEFTPRFVQLVVSLRQAL